MAVQCGHGVLGAALDGAPVQLDGCLHQTGAQHHRRVLGLHAAPPRRLRSAARRARRRRRRPAARPPARRSARRSGAWCAARRPGWAPGRTARRPGRPAPHRPPRTPAGRGPRRAAAGRPAGPPRAAASSSSARPSTTRRRRPRRAGAGCRGGGGTGCRCRAGVPSSRCRVTADRWPSRSRSTCSRSCAGGRDRLLQPGGGLAGRGASARSAAAAARRAAACSASSASSPATVVVLPVPGPPVSTVVHCRAARRDGRALLVVGVAGEDPRAGRPSSAACVDHRRRPRQARLQVGRRPGPPAASSGRGTAARGPAARTPAADQRAGGHRSAQPSGSGQASSGATSATVARSTQTEPWRTARVASATASSTRSSLSPPAGPTRDATCTSAALSTPATLKSCEQAGGRRAPAGRRRRR